MRQKTCIEITELTPSLLPTDFALAAKVGPLENSDATKSQGKDKKAAKLISKGRLRQALNVKTQPDDFQLKEAFIPQR